MWQNYFISIAVLFAFGFNCVASSMENEVLPDDHNKGLDILTSQLKELNSIQHRMEKDKTQANAGSPHETLTDESSFNNPAYGYDKAAMLLMKRYVDALRKRTDPSLNQYRKKSIYGPGIYPFYGMYGKRFDNNPKFGYNPEVMDMIRNLVRQTEAEIASHKIAGSNHIKASKPTAVGQTSVTVTSSIGGTDDKGGQVKAFSKETKDIHSDADDDEHALETIGNLVAHHEN